MPSNKKIILKNKSSEIVRLADFVVLFGSENSLSDAIVNRVNMCLEELVTNIIKYGCDNDAQHEIEILFEIEDDKLKVKVTDDAKPFDPLLLPTPDVNKPLEERPVGGLGIYLVKNVMDSVEYKREEGKNIIVMEIKIGF